VTLGDIPPKGELPTLIIAMKRGGTSVFEKRVKKTKRQAVWPNDEQLEILERLAEDNSCRKADILRMGMMNLARNQGVIEKGWPIRLKP
jgi:predicted phage gp36 major capsid-like protein